MRLARPALLLLPLALLARTSPARACGGGFHAEAAQAPATIGTQRALLELSPTEVEATFEIRGSGPADGFVWVLPVPGFTDLVEASADTFERLDAETRPSVYVETYEGDGSADGDGGCGCADRGVAGGDAEAGGGAGTSSPVEVIASGTVGPLAYDVIAPGDPAAMGAWLRAEGYAIPEGVDGLLQRYGAAGMSFVWAKGRPGTSLDELKPLRIRWPRAAGAPLTYGLELSRAGAAAQVGVTLWVLADSGRVEPGAPWELATVREVAAAVRRRDDAAYEPAFQEVLAGLGPRAFVVEAGVIQPNGQYLTRLRTSVARDDLVDVPLVETGARDELLNEQWAAAEPRRGGRLPGASLFLLGAALAAGAAGKRRLFR